MGDQDRSQAYSHRAYPWRKHQVPCSAPRRWQFLLGIRIDDPQNSSPQCRVQLHQQRAGSYQYSREELRRADRCCPIQAVVRAALWYQDRQKEGDEEDKKNSNHVDRKLKKRQATRVLAKELETQFNTGRLFAKISSRPGQSGRCDGVILEGAELKFYLSRMSKKK